MAVECLSLTKPVDSLSFLIDGSKAYRGRGAVLLAFTKMLYSLVVALSNSYFLHDQIDSIFFFFLKTEV